MKLLKKLPKYKDAAQVKKALNLPRTKEENLLFWICNTYGSTFTLATDSFIIPGFPSDVQQFIIANQLNSPRQDIFEQEFEKTKAKSTVLFHGTSLDNLFSIMADGFRASTDTTYGTGNFMGDTPRTAYIYAHHRACLIRDEATGNYATEKWNWRSSRDRAVMLGCQVAGNGRVVNDVSERTGKVHVIENMQSIAVRYVFLLPDIAYKSRDEDFKAPDKKLVDKPLGEAFKRFPTRKQVEEEKRKQEEAEKLAEETRRKEEVRRKEETERLEDEAKASREQNGCPWTSQQEEVKSMRDQLHLPGLPVLC